VPLIPVEKSPELKTKILIFLAGLEPTRRSLRLKIKSSYVDELLIVIIKGDERETIPDFITECGASHLVTDFSPLREIRSCRNEEVVKMILSSFQVLPPGKGSLYNRLFLMGTEVVLGLAPAPEYTFLAYLCFSCWKLLQGCSSL
ncbi:unnamed protein product, partial [Brassica oleracea]